MPVSEIAVPFNGLVLENAEIKDAALRAITEVVDSSWFIGGGEVERFESRIAAETDTAAAVAVNSGTDALRLAIQMANLPAGSDIITVANTFVATVGAAREEGHTVTLVDVGPDENIDVKAAEAAIGPSTSAIIAVHLRGLPADLPALRELCERRGLVLIEDCAQALGATHGERRIGSFGAAGAFSMHPLKNLGAFGDAGVVVTDDTDLAARMRQHRNHGLVDRDTVGQWGMNSRLDALQAAVLNVKLDRLDTWTARRRDIAERFNSTFSELPVTLPGDGIASRHVYHRYVLRTDDRDALAASLSDRGVQTAIHYPIPIHQQPAMSPEVRVAELGLSATEVDAETIISLPLYPQLTDEQVEHVCSAVMDHFNQAKGL